MILAYLTHDEVNRIYKRLVLGEGGRTVLGGVLVGDTAAYQLFVQMMRGDMPVPDNVEELVVSGSGLSSAGAGALSDTATVCSCNNVTKSKICAAIADGGEPVARDA